MKRQIFLTTLFLLSVCNAMQAENIVIESGDWKISYIESSKSFRINHKKEDGSYRPVFINSIPEATYDLGEVKGRTITSATCSAVEYRAMETVDEFGIGIAIRIIENFAILNGLSLEKFQATKTSDKWIPCSKELPKKSGIYYVSGKWKDRPEEVWLCEFLYIDFMG